MQVGYGTRRCGHGVVMQGDLLERRDVRFAFLDNMYHIRFGNQATQASHLTHALQSKVRGCLQQDSRRCCVLCLEQIKACAKGEIKKVKGGRLLVFV